jgi:hypothetical protein
MAKERAVPYRAQYIHKETKISHLLKLIKITLFRYIPCAITQNSLKLTIPYLESLLLLVIDQFRISDRG